MFQAESKLLKEAQILMCTLSTSASEKLIRVERKFDLCIIDESAQTTEISTLIPFRHKINKVIMIGDHKQLPATVFSETNKELGYEISLFERLQHLNVESNMLEIQYRMHESIRYFPSQMFYSGKIRDGAHLSNPQYHNPPTACINRRNVFIDLEDSNEVREGGETSVYNPDEIDIIIKIVNMIK